MVRLLLCPMLFLLLPYGTLWGSQLRALSAGEGAVFWQAVELLAVRDDATVEKMRRHKTCVPQSLGREVASRRVVFVMDVSGFVELGKLFHIKRVQQELERCVEHMFPKVFVWRKHLVRAINKNIKKPCKFIDSLVAEGQTNTEEALHAAFSIKDGITSYYYLTAPCIIWNTVRPFW